uniref:Linker for activation of T-cells family member 1 isoform X2 n=1 Tax=Phascolarctos cinereus TaxID=38626 RepID=A0A6P5LVE0_PHACI|nr:linker for activation of T-cells family member 1 isoform X2 [Phascolarctos cinereus]
METTSLGPSLLWLLILLFPALLVTALCLCCRDFPGPNSEVSPSDSSYQPSSGLVILKRPYTNTSWPSAVSCQPDLLPIPRSPQHPGLSHRITSRRDADTQPEDADEEDDYHNEGYLEVLPDDCPNSSSAPLSNSAPNLGSPGLRDSPSSMVWGEDYVNVLESTEVSLGGSCEYVNMPEAQEERTPSNRTPVTDQEGEEEGPDYENVQEQNGHSFT